MKQNEEIQKNVAKIIEKLTPEQKLAQLNCMFCGGQIPSEMLHRFKNGVGEIAVMPGTDHKEERLKAAEEEQKVIMAHCGIPAIRHNEAVTGQMDRDSTVFPSAIGLGAT